MKLFDLIDRLERLVPSAYAEPWDKVGLLIGDPNQEIQSVLLALDLTTDVLQTARSVKADLILCHHPAIFSPLSTLRDDHRDEQRLIALIRDNRSLLALHTNLDAVPGGVADQLALLLELEGIETLAELPAQRTNGVTLEKSAWSRGFSARPGFGRIGDLPSPARLSVVTRQLRQRLHTPHLMILAKEDSRIAKVAVCPGSFDGEWVPLVTAAKCDLLVTGEIKHHVQLELFEAGVAVVTAGHDVSERIVLEPLARLLQDVFPQVGFAVSLPFDYNKIAF